MKKKVLQVLQSVGGLEVYLNHLIENIDSNEFEFYVLSDKNDDKRYFPNGVEIPTYSTTLFREINLFNDFKALKCAIRLIEEIKPDLIHCHSAKGGVIGRLAGWWTGVPVLYTPHAISYMSTVSKLKRFIFWNLEKRLFFKKTRLLACGPSELNRVKNDLKVANKKLWKWDNSIPDINERLSDLSTEYNLPEKYICFVGRPSYQKNIPSLLRIIIEIRRSFPEIHLVLMGIGHYAPDLEEVKQIIKDNKLDSNVTLIDWTDRITILKIIKQSIAYVSTARYEGLPYSVIESLSLGVPAVVYDVDGNRDLVEHQKTGFIVEEGDEKKAAEYLIQLNQDQKLRNQMAVNARSYFKNNHDIAKNIGKLQELYNKAIALK